MALQLGPVPNFNVQVPNITQKALEGAQLKNMMSEMSLRQSLAPLQIQEQQQKVQQETMANELQRIQLEGQKSLQKWLQEGDTNEDIPADQFKLNDKIATYVGVDPKDPIMQVVRSMAQHGVPAPMLMAEAKGMFDRRSEYNKGTEEQQKIIKENYDTWKDAMGRIFNADPKDRSLLIAQALPRLQAATHLSPELDSMVNLLRQNPEMGAPIAYNLVAAQEKALGLGKAAAEKKVEEQKVIPEGGGLSAESQQGVQKAVAEQKALLPGKVVEQQALLPGEIKKATATEVSKQLALAPQLQQIASTTRNGRVYINREDIPKGSEGVVEQQAASAGLPIVDKDTAGTLSDIDEAKANMQSMLSIVSKKLAKGPGERIYKGPENKLEAAMQTDPDLAAMGTFRNAAIKTMRAVAGSKGLRINQAEIQMAIDNDIPKMTDTWDVAQAKINQLTGFLDNAEATHLTRNRMAVTPSGAQPAGGGHAPQVGAVEDGYRFKGGDASKPENWEKVKK